MSNLQKRYAEPGLLANRKMSRDYIFQGATPAIFTVFLLLTCPTSTLDDIFYSGLIRGVVGHLVVAVDKMHARTSV